MSSLLLLPVPGDVRVWRIDLDGTTGGTSHLLALLSLAERVQAASFREARDRLRYIVAHGRLREILSRHTGIAARDLSFRPGENGKPFLVRNHPHSDLQFSLSRSEDRALVAVATGRPVGVDIERIDPDTDVLAIAERVFAVNERAALRALPEARRLERFFQMWVCKEAYVKARGDGIIDRLASFTVSIDAASAVHLVDDARDPTAPTRWRMQLIESPMGFAAAVAAGDVRTPILLNGRPEDARTKTHTG